MADLALARVVHLLSVLLWIGGVAFVTMVVMPSIRRDYPENERLGAFSRIESGFAPQARVWVLFAGASGFWMVWRADMWSRFPEPAFWWMSAMVAVWAVFALMLFVLEPMVIHRRMRTSADPAADFARMVKDAPGPAGGIADHLCGGGRREPRAVVAAPVFAKPHRLLFLSLRATCSFGPPLGRRGYGRMILR